MLYFQIELANKVRVQQFEITNDAPCHIMRQNRQTKSMCI